jgi:Alpha amylase, catalytic domain
MRAGTTLSMIVLASVALIGAGCEPDRGTKTADVSAVPSRAGSSDDASRANPFTEGTGWFYHYVRATDDYPATPYADITARIEDGYYTDRGASNIMIYGPYRASGEFRGLPAIDYFDAQVGTGTVDDFRDLVEAAHSKGITVTIYLAFLSVHPTNQIFRTAESDVRDSIDSPEAHMFRWAQDEPAPSDTPPDFPEYEGGWAFSETAGQWYATSWGYPAPDYAQPATRDYVEDVLRFWLDTGVDGIEYDYVLSMLGMRSDDMTVADPNMTDLLITTPLTATPNAKWLHAEGAGQFWDEAWNDAVGFTHILINGDEDRWSFPYAVMDGGATERRKTVADLEAHWQTYFDERRERNPDLGVNAWSLYVFDMSAEQRALDAAVQAGMGALYSIDVEEIYSRLTEAERTAYDDVFSALKRSPALAPGASRVQRPAAICGGGSADQVYAVERTSADGTRTALNVYNFTDTPRCITIDLTDSGIAVPQTPVDLSTERDGTPITSSSYDVQLPPFGYVFLDVDV